VKSSNLSGSTRTSTSYKVFLGPASLSLFLFGQPHFIAFSGAAREPSDTTLSIPSSYPHTLTHCFPNITSSNASVYFSAIYPCRRTMEIYTTSFTYPRRSRLTHSPASSLDFSTDLRPQPDSYSQLHQQHVNSTLQDPQGTVSPSDYEAVQKVAMMAMAVYSVQVTFASADQGRAWNFQVSGVYQQVMLARATIMKECPVQVSLQSPQVVPGASFDPCCATLSSRTAPL
jgi:hypothetical protein